MSWLKSLRRRQAESITGVFVANEQGWWLQQTDQPSAAADYLEQLRDGGLGTLDAQGRPGLTWNTVYALLADRQHSDSIYLLGLPELSQARPVLRSTGTPSQADFAVRISGWRLPGRPDALMPREGALLLEPEGRRLLTPASWGLLGELRYLAANGSSLGGDARMRQMGRIQQAAMSCSAELDGYLSSSPVVVADQLDLEIAAEGEMVMLTPRLLAGPQQGWIQAVDSYQSVRSRYDVVGNAGHLTHVVLDDAARGVVGAIKQFPGRRLFGDKARQFLDNPYPFLDDDAEKALSPERYEAARLRWEQTSGAAEPSADGVVHREPPGSATDTPMVDGAHDVDCPVNSPGQQWLPPLAPPSSGNHKGTLSLADLLDLSQYSDRVVEIEGKVVNVPRIPPDKVSQDWIEGVEDALHQSPDDRSSDKGWQQQIIVTGLDAHELETFERLIRHGQENGDSHVTLPGTDHRIPLEAARQWLDDLKRLARRQIGNDAQKLSRPDAPRHATQVALGILHNIDELEYIEASRQELDFADEPYHAPAALRAGVQLKQHQHEGVARMQAMLGMRGQGIAGMLLADDMGLGKTLQSLALMAWYRQTAAQPRPCLIVAPVSLLENWKAEIDKFLDGRQGATLTLYGSYLREHRVPDTQIPPAMRESGIKRLLREGFADNAAFVLTTYETLRDYQISLGRERWGVLICDEAQKIKTPAALVTRAAKAMQAEFRIACTGTPVENTLADLWCLFDFLQPGLLNSLSQFTRHFRQSIERREEDHPLQVERLRARIRPWVLRRMKRDVADLMPKHEHQINLPMSALQRQLYRQTVRKFQQALADVVAEGQGNALSGLSLELAEQTSSQLSGKSTGKGMAALTLLHHLRMICANPVAAARQKPDLVPVQEHLGHSPKLAWLLDTLQDIAQQGARAPDHGNKVIVFTEFLPMQRLVQRAVAERFGFRPHIVNGSTSVVAGRDDSRQALIDAFQQAPGFGVIVLSTVAVGFGVNIQGANHVIHFTRPWNPAKEDQATDRAYRIGQTRAVHVYYPTIVGDGFESFEERVATRLAGKRALSADMLSPEQSLTADDFLGLEGG